jgi:hypothetical protein
MQTTEPAAQGNPGEILGSTIRRAEAGANDRSDEIESLKARIKELQVERKRLESLANTISPIDKSVEQKQWCRALSELRGAKKLDVQLEEFDPPSVQKIKDAESWIEQNAQESINALPRTLIFELGDEKPDPESRFPRFVFRRSFLIVEINRTKHIATVTTRTGRAVKLDADAVTVAEHIRSELSRCFDRETDLDDFARRLRNAWQTTEAGRRGDSAGLREVAAQLGDDVALDEFSVDLSRLITAADGSVSAAEGLKLDHTKEIKKGLLLPDLEDRGYYGTLVFRPKT